ncbi:MAG: hypothetical protein J6C55_03280 [Oscillospiraceae bacterium]|nr:hypothetical protein [Oscillospiraceae bacterium]
MADEVVIRKANINDIDVLETLSKQFFETQLEINNIFKQENITKLTPRISIKERLNNKSFCFFIAEYKSIGIGYAGVQLAERDILFEAKDYVLLVDMFINKDIFKKLNFYKITSDLFGLCEKFARDNNRKFLCADVYGDNSRVKKLIETKDFREYRIRYVKELK